MNAFGNNVMNTELRHFLDLDKVGRRDARHIMSMAHDLKKRRVAGQEIPELAGKSLALIFEKPSTRTRVSFEVAMRQLGGDVVLLTENDSQLGRGETIADTARVLSRYVDIIMLRTSDPAKLEELAAYASVPVINGLTDLSHPCQLMADVMTMQEHFDTQDLAGRTVAWVGDGNNMANTWIQAAAIFGFDLRLACPDQLQPSAGVIRWATNEGAVITTTSNPQEAVAGADVVVTDTWVSMGDEDAEQRHRLLQPYQVNDDLMALAAPHALFMHCLPAHRGEEVTDAVMDGPRSVVWDEAENRLHAQKGILAWCLGAKI